MTRSRAGFTLVEVMVALVLSGIVIAAAHQGMVVVTDARQRAESSRETVVAAAGARAMLSSWLRASVQPPGTSAFRESETPGLRESEEVTFVVSDGGALYPGARRIRLWVDRDPRTPGGGLMAEVSRRRGEVGVPDTLSLEPTVGRMAVRYWGSVDGADRWVDVWDRYDGLPRVVELRLDPVVRATLGPGGAAEVSELPPLLRPAIVVPVAMGAW